MTCRLNAAPAVAAITRKQQISTTHSHKPPEPLLIIAASDRSFSYQHRRLHLFLPRLDVDQKHLTFRPPTSSKPSVNQKRKNNEIVADHDLIRRATKTPSIESCFKCDEPA
jgi:hypothetical protein